MSDKEKLNEWELEIAWRNTAEYKYFLFNSSIGDYDIRRDTYKARQIYALYGYKRFYKFIQERPHIFEIMRDYVPCRNEECQFQCTMFCYKYDKERGCALNVNE